MATPQELTALTAFHQAAEEVARVFDEFSPWGSAATTIAGEVGNALERMTGTYTIEIPADKRVLFRQAIKYADVSTDDRSPEAEAFLASLRGSDEASLEGPWEITVDSVSAQGALAEVLKECVNEAIRTISPEKVVDKKRREEFDAEVEAVDFWFGLLGCIEPVKGDDR